MTTRVSLAGLAVVWLLVATAAGAGTLPRPYAPSGHVAGWQLDFATHDRRAPGSDNWPVTWADDGHQYASWGDGGGFGGTNSNGRVSLGVARIEGSATSWAGFNVWGGFDPENPAQFDGKSYGLLSVDGILYLWWGPGSNTTSYTETRLAYSTDHSATWTRSDWDLVDTDERLIMPTICNFGRDYEGARDDFVYHYFVRKEPTGPGLGIHRGGDPPTGKIDLARAPRSQLLDRGALEFFAGLDVAGDPIWSFDALDRQPVFEDPNGVGWNLSVSFNAGLGRYLLMTEHEVSNAGLVGLFDAPEPWGPWTTVLYHDTVPFGDGEVPETTFYWNFANKWASADGRDFTLVFTGTGVNDSWNSVRGSFDALALFVDGFETGDTSRWSSALP